MGILLVSFGVITFGSFTVVMVLLTAGLHVRQQHVKRNNPDNWMELERETGENIAKALNNTMNFYKGVGSVGLGLAKRALKK